MSAKNYKICPALFNAYIAKVSKKDPRLVTDDRREITEEEILCLIDWYLDQKADEGENGIGFKSQARDGMNVIMEFRNREEEENGH